MSLDYGNTVLLAQGRATPTPAAGTQQLFGFKNYSGLILSIDCIVVAQGAQALSAVKIQTSASADLAEIVIGAAAIGTMFEDKVADADVVRAAATYYKVVAVTIDATLVYDWRVYGSAPFA